MITKILFVPFLLLSLFNCSSDERKKMSQEEFVGEFVENFAAYKMDIQAAGIAAISSATLSKENQLTVEYSYHSEGENRKGRMTLMLNSSANHFEGNWKTEADNGNVYQGSLNFSFKENGEADGTYKFERLDHKISIYLPTKNERKSV